MKRLIIMSLAICILICMSACGNDNSKQVTTDNSEVAQNSSTEQQSTDKTPSANNVNELTGIYRVPMENIYVNTPAYQEIENGFTEIFIVHESKYAAITASINDTATTSEEAHTKAFEKFKQNIQSYSYVNSLTITEDSSQTINGIDIYKYEGTLNCGHDTVYEAYAIGYSFVMDGIPCEIIGSVIDKSQSQELKEEIKAVVGAMVKSVRTAE